MKYGYSNFLKMNYNTNMPQHGQTSLRFLLACICLLLLTWDAIGFTPPLDPWIAAGGSASGGGGSSSSGNPLAPSLAIEASAFPPFAWVGAYTGTAGASF